MPDSTNWTDMDDGWNHYYATLDLGDPIIANRYSKRRDAFFAGAIVALTLLHDKRSTIRRLSREVDAYWAGRPKG